MDINELREKYRKLRDKSTGSSTEERGKRAAYSDFICMTYDIGIQEIKEALQQFIKNEEDKGVFMLSMRNTANEILTDLRRMKC